MHHAEAISPNSAAVIVQNQSLNLFPDIAATAPETEGIKYAGSKLKLIPHILQLIRGIKPTTVLDGFSGTTRVSQALAKCGYSVVANDLSAWSEIFGHCYLLNKQPASYYGPIIDHLNELPGKDGWFSEHYGGNPDSLESLGEDGLKKPWQIHNTRRLDAIREEIDLLGVSGAEKAVLLTSLILALDQVESTLGHFASYLNGWSPRSFKKLKLKVPDLILSENSHVVCRGDIFDLLPKVNVDLAYFDPPYGSNNEKMPPSRVRYSAYYHIWTSVCLNDQPKLFGKAKRRSDTSDRVSGSVFEEFRRNEIGKFLAVDAIERLLGDVNARHVVLSYSSGGRATADQLKNAINHVGKIVDIVEVDYKRNVMASMKWTSEWVRDTQESNREFLFLIEK